jgi:hypothetical protein
VFWLTRRQHCKTGMATRLKFIAGRSLTLAQKNDLLGAEVL